MTDLIAAMDKVNSVLGQLADLAHEKKELIILGKVKELDNLIRKEGIVISELERLEDARFRLQSKLVVKNAAAAPANAREILEITRLDYPQLASVMDECLSRLDFNLTRLRMLNQRNHELLESSLDHIAFLEAAINGDSAVTYSDKGMGPNGKTSRVNLLDRKI